MPGGSSIRVSTTRETQPDERSGAERDPARSGVATSPPGRSTLPRLAHPGFHSKSFLVSFLLPSHQPMKIHRVIPEEPVSLAHESSRIMGLECWACCLKSG